MSTATKYDLWLNEQILNLAAQGYYADVIADRLSVTTEQVQSRARMHGVVIAPRRGKASRRKSGIEQVTKLDPSTVFMRSVIHAHGGRGHRLNTRGRGARKNPELTSGYAPVTNGLYDGSKRATGRGGQSALWRWIKTDGTEAGQRRVEAHQKQHIHKVHVGWLKKRKRIRDRKAAKQTRIDATWKSREAELGQSGEGGTGPHGGG